MEGRSAELLHSGIVDLGISLPSLPVTVFKMAVPALGKQKSKK